MKSVIAIITGVAIGAATTWLLSRKKAILTAPVLRAGEVLHVGDSKSDPEGESFFILQSDGNAVHYAGTPGDVKYYIWSTGKESLPISNDYTFSINAYGQMETRLSGKIVRINGAQFQNAPDAVLAIETRKLPDGALLPIVSIKASDGRVLGQTVRYHNETWEGCVPTYLCPAQ